jgi:NAD(P)-dependent dehydrogenase (short-subunit alcohol dehydrogenase family)
VVSISPGYTDTPIWKTFDDALKKQAIANVPIKRFIRPEEIADFVITVIKNDAITGVNLSITGGLHLKSII